MIINDSSRNTVQVKHGYVYGYVLSLTIADSKNNSNNNN